MAAKRSRLYVCTMMPHEAQQKLFLMRRIVRMRLAELRGEYADQGIEWQQPQNWHVTLEHVGIDYNAAWLNTWLLTTRLPKVTATMEPRFEMFANNRVLYVPVNGLDALAAVVKEGVIATHGAERAGHIDYPFRGHITIARGLMPPGLGGDVDHPEVEAVTWEPSDVRIALSHQGAAHKAWRQDINIIPL